MKIKLFNSLIIIDILIVLLILAIIFIPSSFLRIILGLPFLLFFPGYTLVAALFARKEGMDGIERIALSFGMSIAVTALIGLGLNYTSWGIRLKPVLYSISAFIIIMSGLALFRQMKYYQALHSASKDESGADGLLQAFKALAMTEKTVRLPGWEGGSFNKTLTVILAVAILGAVGTLAYVIAVPKVGERFSEFYILGNDGKAEGYPSDFVLNSSRLAVVSVQYGSSLAPVQEKYGRVTLGIVNHEQKKASYSVVMQVDGEIIPIIPMSNNTNNPIPSPSTNTTNNTNATNTTNIPISNPDGSFTIVLAQGEKWEQVVGFAPQHVGDNQKVEFLLYKDGASAPEDSLHLWVNVK